MKIIDKKEIILISGGKSDDCTCLVEYHTEYTEELAKYQIPNTVHKFEYKTPPCSTCRTLCCEAGLFSKSAYVAYCNEGDEDNCGAC